MPEDDYKLRTNQAKGGASYHGSGMFYILLTCEEHMVLEYALHHFQELMFHIQGTATTKLLSSREGK